jgi:hypothetical protein
VKVCLVLGAGASLAQEQHFRPRRKADQSQPPLDTTFFEKVDALGIRLTPALRSFIRSLTGADADLAMLRGYRMEEFFKDAYFEFRDRPLDRPARAAYTDLVVLYNRVLRETTNWLCDDGHERGPLGKLIAASAAHAEELTIITFNHDLLIENEIFKRARLRPRWCITESYGSFGDNLTPLPGDGYEFPVHDDRVCDHTRPIYLLKLHGSLNWIVRIHGRQPTVNDLSGAGRLRDVFLDCARVIERPLLTRPGQGRGRKTWNSWPVVVPPIYAKHALISHLKAAWDDARAAVAAADTLIFFGYSLPQLDIEAEKMIQRGLTRNRRLQWIDVVNPDPYTGRDSLGSLPSVAYAGIRGLTTCSMSIHSSNEADNWVAVTTGLDNSIIATPPPPISTASPSHSAKHRPASSSPRFDGGRKVMQAPALHSPRAYYPAHVVWCDIHVHPDSCGEKRYRHTATLTSWCEG